MSLAMYWPRVRRGMIGVTAVCALLLLAACGGAGASGPGAAPTATTRAGGKLTVKPCLGAYDASSSPTITLGDVSHMQSGVVHVGDTVEVRMDGQHSWSLDRIAPTGYLAASNRVGMFDSATGSCVWRFHADATGAVAITFTGLALCDPTQACPQYAINQTYNVTIN